MVANHSDITRHGNTFGFRMYLCVKYTVFRVNGIDTMDIVNRSMRP